MNRTTNFVHYLHSLQTELYCINTANKNKTELLNKMSSNFRNIQNLLNDQLFLSKEHDGFSLAQISFSSCNTAKMQRLLCC